MNSLSLVSTDLSIPEVIHGLSLNLFSLLDMGQRGACFSSTDLKLGNFASIRLYLENVKWSLTILHLNLAKSLEE